MTSLVEWIMDAFRGNIPRWETECVIIVLLAVGFAVSIPMLRPFGRTSAGGGFSMKLNMGGPKADAGKRYAAYSILGALIAAALFFLLIIAGQFF